MKIKASYIIVDSRATPIMDFSRAGITPRLTGGLEYVINKINSDQKSYLTHYSVNLREKNAIW